MKKRLILVAAIILAWLAYLAWQRHAIEQAIG
jgi:hypothetical protein